MDTLINKFQAFNMDEYDERENKFTEFISSLDNEYQSEIILKLICGYSGTIYLEDFIDDVLSDTMTISVLGSRNSKGREKYYVTIKDNQCTCTCKDFLYRSKKHNIVCKHITFIICKIACIFDYDYFETKKLSEYQINLIRDILHNNALWKNRDLSIKNLNEEFTKNEKEFNPDDSCPICYELLKDKNTVSCPNCNNYIHKDCMDTWLETKNTCVYCRSYDWQNYITDINKL